MKDVTDNLIVITHCSLTSDPELVFDMGDDDKCLIGAIEFYADEIKKNGVEIFDQKRNIIVTNEGFYCAFWNNDLMNDEGDKGV